MLAVIQETMIGERRAAHADLAAQNTFAHEGEELADVRVQVADELDRMADPSLTGNRDLSQYSMLTRRIDDVGGETG